MIEIVFLNLYDIWFSMNMESTMWLIKELPALTDIGIAGKVLQLFLLQFLLPDFQCFGIQIFTPLDNESAKGQV